MAGTNETRNISPRPEWSFAEVIQHAWQIYTGGGIESGGRRNVLYRIWAAMVGAERAVAELEHFISVQGGIEPAAHTLGCAVSTVQRLIKQFSLVDNKALVPLPLRLAPGEELQGESEVFIVDKLLGTGGMGVVYRVKGKESDEQYAAKVLSSERFVISNVVRDRFERECLLAQSFDSEYVVRSYECLRHRGTLVSRQELLSGRSLYDELASQQPPIPKTQRLRWVRDATRGLAYLHNNDIVHRDISPRNCLLRENGAVAVGDFGVARRTDDHTMTMLHERMGSLIYISPQQRENPHLASFRDDIYALGQLAYHILTGTSPHGGTEQIKDCGFPRELDTLVKSSRSAKPSERPKDAIEFLKVLEAITEIENDVR